VTHEKGIPSEALTSNARGCVSDVSFPVESSFEQFERERGVLHGTKGSKSRREGRIEEDAEVRTIKGKAGGESSLNKGSKLSKAETESI